MKLPGFLENLFYVKPFQLKSGEVFKNNSSITYANSDDDRNFILVLCINKKILEFTKKYGEPLEVKEFHISSHGLKDWKDKVIKIKNIKTHGEICLPHETISKISSHLSNHKRYIQLNMDEIREIYKYCIHFERDFYKENYIDVNVNMNLGRQNHWLD